MAVVIPDCGTRRSPSVRLGILCLPRLPGLATVPPPVPHPRGRRIPESTSARQLFPVDRLQRQLVGHPTRIQDPFVLSVPHRILSQTH